MGKGAREETAYNKAEQMHKHVAAAHLELRRATVGAGEKTPCQAVQLEAELLALRGELEDVFLKRQEDVEAVKALLLRAAQRAKEAKKLVEEMAAAGK